MLAANWYGVPGTAVIDDLRGRGITSLGAIAEALNGSGMVTARGGKWHASSVRNLLARL